MRDAVKKNIIFDVGKVLVSYEPDAYMESQGLDEETRTAINGAMFKNKLWDMLDQGVISAEEALEKFIAGAPKYETQIRQIFGTVGKTIELYPYAMEWIQNLKARGHKVYILSNYAEHTMEQTREKLKFLDLVDGAVFSYECKQVKPNAKIYEHLRKKYSLNCSECIFIDDRPENVEAAKRNGIPAFEFKNYEQAKQVLDEMLQY